MRIILINCEYDQYYANILRVNISYKHFKLIQNYKYITKLIFLMFI